MPAGAAKGPLPFDLTVLDPKARIQCYIDHYKDDPEYNGFEGLLMRTIEVISASKGSSKEGMEASATFELTCPPGLCNPMDRMHGGAMATLADMATTMATAPVSSKDFWEFGGVSRTLNVTYLRPVFLDETITIDCSLKSIGRRLSVTQCVVKLKQSGKLVALAEHGKSALGDQLLAEQQGSKL